MQQRQDASAGATRANTVFDYQLYLGYLRSKLQTLFENFQRDMLLVMDDAVKQVLNYVVGMKFLRENGVAAHVSLARIGADRTAPEVKAYKQVVFFVAATVYNMKEIERALRDAPDGDRAVDVVLWPKKTQACVEALDRLGVRSRIREPRFFGFDLIPLEEDVLSLEAGLFVRQLHLDDDNLVLEQVVESLERIQLLYGRFPNRFFKGELARVVLDMLSLRAQQAAAEGAAASPDADASAAAQQTAPEIEAVIVLDRATDLVTPLLSQPTFEGVLDEMFEFKCGLIPLPVDLVYVTPEEQQRRQ